MAVVPVLMDSYFGAPEGDRLTADSNGIPAGHWSSQPFKSMRAKKCIGKEDTCNGYHTKTSQYCQGCLNKMTKEERCAPPVPHAGDE